MTTDPNQKGISYQDDQQGDPSQLCIKTRIWAIQMVLAKYI